MKSIILKQRKDYQKILAGRTRLSARRRRGASIVEFALVLPLLLTLLLGILESAWLGRAALSVANSARESARMASLGKTTAQIRTRAKNVSSFLNLQDSEITCAYNTDGGTTYGTTLGDSSGKNNAPAGAFIRVKIVHPHTVLTGFFPFLNGRYDQAEVVMRREAN